MNELDNILKAFDENPSVSVLLENTEDAKLKANTKTIIAAQRKEIASRVAAAKKATTKNTTAMEAYKQQLGESAEKLTAVNKQLESFSAYEPIITEHKNKIRAEKYKDLVAPEMLGVAFKLGEVGEEDSDDEVKAKLIKTIEEYKSLDFKKVSVPQVKKDFPQGTPNTNSFTNLVTSQNNNVQQIVPSHMRSIADSKTDNSLGAELIAELMPK